MKTAETPQSSGLVGQCPARSVRPGVPTCDSESSTEDKAGSPHEHPSPCRPPRPLHSLIGGWAIRVIMRRMGGSGQHIETVGPVPVLDKASLELDRVCLSLPATPGGCRLMTTLSVPAPMWLG